MPQVGTVRIVPAHYPPPDHGGRHQCGLRFFIFHRLTPAVPASSPPPGPALPPPHTDSRLPDDTSVQHSLAPRPPLRRPNQPPTHTSCRASPRPHAPARTREKLRSPPPHIRILAHLHLSPTPCSRAPPKLPLSPPRNARKNVTPHPAGRLPAPSRTSKCLPSPAGTKKAAAR